MKVPANTYTRLDLLRVTVLLHPELDELFFPNIAHLHQTKNVFLFLGIEKFDQLASVTKTRSFDLLARTELGTFNYAAC